MIVVIFVKIGVFFVSRMWILVNVLLGFNCLVGGFFGVWLCLFGIILEGGSEIVGLGVGVFCVVFEDLVWLLIVWMGIFLLEIIIMLGLVIWFCL